MQRLLYFTQENSSYFFLAVHTAVFVRTQVEFFEGLVSGQGKVTNCSTTGKPTRSFATERVSLDSV